ncbi:MAG: hypothetical protein SVV67_08990 [Bacillota bacterium]|nr:hypothetical protein [Bacillota bacterium]
MSRSMNNSNTNRSGTNCRVIGEYFSRKNHVLKIRLEDSSCPGSLLILKKFPSARQAEMEFNNLLELKKSGIKVPWPMGLDGPALYMQYLEGLLLTDIIEKEMLPRAAWTGKMACWYANLHLSSIAGKTGKNGALLKTDNNLRNFIYAGEDFYGLDFEEINTGDPARDIGQICAFILTDRPAFTMAKKTAAGELARRYLSLNRSANPARIEQEVLVELEKMAMRRKEEELSIREYINALPGGRINLFSS